MLSIQRHFNMDILREITLCWISLNQSWDARVDLTISSVLQSDVAMSWCNIVLAECSECSWPPPWVHLLWWELPVGSLEPHHNCGHSAKRPAQTHSLDSRETRLLSQKTIKRPAQTHSLDSQYEIQTCPWILTWIVFKRFIFDMNHKVFDALFDICYLIWEFSCLGRLYIQDHDF